MRQLKRDLATIPATGGQGAGDGQDEHDLRRTDVQRRWRFNYYARLRFIGFLFVLPTLAFFAVFSVYPMLKAFQVSFTRWDLVTPPQYVGLANYVRLLRSPGFLQACKATAYYIVLADPAAWILGFGLAVLLNARFPGRDFFRSVFFLPSVFPVIGMSLAWFVLFQPTGLINQVLGTRIVWLTRSRSAMPAIAIMDIWRAMGYYMVLFLVGLQSIPHEYYEAGKIDGASSWQLLRHITIPLMQPVFALVVVIGLIGGVQVLVPMMVMTAGGPGNATRSVVQMIYQTGFQNWRMGDASAMSIVLFLFLFALTALQLKFFHIGQEDR
jgi:multiple sugar transport system permease protein